MQNAKEEFEEQRFSTSCKCWKYFSLELASKCLAAYYKSSRRSQWLIMLKKKFVVKQTFRIYLNLLIIIFVMINLINLGFKITYYEKTCIIVNSQT